MTIRSTQLEEAIEYCDRLASLLVFKRGFETWGGSVDCTFGSYKVTFSECCRDEILKAIEIEERMLRNTLELWGVTLPPEPFLP